MTASDRSDAERGADAVAGAGTGAGAGAGTGELSSIFTGELSPYRDALVFSDPERPAVTGRSLLRPDTFDAAVAPFLARYPDADRRAVISLWSQWYFSALVVPSVSAVLLLERELPLALGELSLLLDTDEHRPTGFRLPHRGRPAPRGEPFRAFHALVRRHLEPLIEAVASHAGLSTGLLWSNAGSYFDWTVRTIGGGGPDGRELGRRVLESRTWPDGRENPLFEPGRMASGEDGETRRRRICCLRYLVPGLEDCGEVCPVSV